ncbi:MAG TPA: glycoside hydrolase family 27 protein [Acidobacteriaceae bacterium]|nr:glycoside hydrolase family 27 protein [Acidobacteriaceae bacterium]
MQIKSNQNRSYTAHKTLRYLLVLMVSFAVLCPAFGQSIAGRWFAPGKTLDNGEQQFYLLNLKQDGSKLTGKIESPGGAFDVTGTVSGDHFTLFAPFNPRHPFLTGEATNGQLHGMVWGHRAFTARPATAADKLPTIPYIVPPPLHNVPYNGLAKTPPMGWNSWNLFAGRVNEKLVKEIADAMVSSGMRDAGYVYVNIDDTWEGTRDAQGNLRPNHKFPDMKGLADYLHARGLKLGIYSSPGPRTCAGYPASYGHEVQDAKTFASWGVDYLKYDWCSAGSIYKNSQLQPVYQKMGAALEATGRPIVFSLCEYGMGHVQTWGKDVGGNLWRTTGDIRDSWASMTTNIEKQVPTAPYAGPGHWNDPDMLEIGNGHMTDAEYRTHMSLWALSAAPLLAGNDLRDMSAATKAILLNKEVIAVDQDPLGKQATPVRNGQLETWVKPLAGGSVAVGVVNFGPATARATIQASQLHLGKKVRHARDLWAHKDVKFRHGAYSADVPSHGILLLRVSAK